MDWDMLFDADLRSVNDMVWADAEIRTIQKVWPEFAQFRLDQFRAGFDMYMAGWPLAACGDSIHRRRGWLAALEVASQAEAGHLVRYDADPWEPDPWAGYDGPPW